MWVEKQSMYHWKANKHAHITIIKLKHKKVVNKKVVIFEILPQIPKNVSSDFANICLHNILYYCRRVHENIRVGK